MLSRIWFSYGWLSFDWNKITPFLNQSKLNQLRLINPNRAVQPSRIPNILDFFNQENFYWYVVRKNFMIIPVMVLIIPDIWLILTIKIHQKRKFWTSLVEDENLKKHTSFFSFFKFYPAYFTTHSTPLIKTSLKKINKLKLITAFTWSQHYMNNAYL